MGVVGLLVLASLIGRLLMRRVRLLVLLVLLLGRSAVVRGLLGVRGVAAGV